MHCTFQDISPLRVCEKGCMSVIISVDMVLMIRKYCYVILIGVQCLLWHTQHFLNECIAVLKPIWSGWVSQGEAE